MLQVIVNAALIPDSSSSSSIKTYMWMTLNLLQASDMLLMPAAHFLHCLLRLLATLHGNSTLCRGHIASCCKGK